MLSTAFRARCSESRPCTSSPLMAVVFVSCSLYVTEPRGCCLRPWLGLMFPSRILGIFVGGGGNTSLCKLDDYGSMTALYYYNTVQSALQPCGVPQHHAGRQRVDSHMTFNHAHPCRCYRTIVRCSPYWVCAVHCRSSATECPLCPLLVVLYSPTVQYQRGSIRQGSVRQLGCTNIHNIYTVLRRLYFWR